MSASAQSNAVIDSILDMETLDHAGASYLVFAASGDISEDTTPTEAFEVAIDRGFIPGAEAADAVALARTPIGLGRYAHMLLATFGSPAGILYSLFPGDRYAAREFAFHGLVPGRTDPYRMISGADGLQILERFLGWSEQ